MPGSQSCVAEHSSAGVLPSPLHLLHSQCAPFATSPSLLLYCRDIAAAPYPLSSLAHVSYQPRAAMAANSIPLHCNICPKKPNFSDVSHLLTHISSKGHLSNYYKVKVRSTHEEASRRLIDTYDRWYGEWGVEELMSERMNQKDKRRTRARPASTP